MAVQEVTMYRVVCDGEDCGASAQDFTDFYAWADAGQAEDDASDADWVITDDRKHYCNECSIWDDERDERVPKAEKVKVS